MLAFADNKTFYFSGELALISIVGDASTHFLLAYVPDAGDKSSYDEFSSCSVGGAFPIETAPPNLKDLSPAEKWSFVSKGFAGWAPQLLVTCSM